MGDFDEVERLQAGIRTWLLRTARSGRHELRDVGAAAVLPLLCAAAFGPALAEAGAVGRPRPTWPGWACSPRSGPTSWPIFSTTRLDAPGRRMGREILRPGAFSRT